MAVAGGSVAAGVGAGDAGGSVPDVGSGEDGGWLAGGDSTGPREPDGDGEGVGVGIGVGTGRGTTAFGGAGVPGSRAATSLRMRFTQAMVRYEP